MKSKIKKLIKTSQKVILDCCLENGAIVAANSTKPYYGDKVKNYFYVWPRDAAFTCLAADILGLKDIQEKFFSWLTERAEGWQKKGIFYEKYYPNGLQALDKFQPDQTGAVIFAIYHHFKNDINRAKKYKELVAKSADGLCGVWNKDHFKIITNDLWEERLTFPDLRDNFSYSLAACIKGLICANALFPNKEYIKIANQMEKVLSASAQKKGYFFRSFGRLNDERIDASILGLIWPFKIVKFNNLSAKKTIKLIEKKLVKDFKVYRYEHDEYDGWMYERFHRKKGAGYWPLLNFWMSIVQSKMGQKSKAMKYFNKVLQSSVVADDYIPEQVFDNNIQQSISPLCWSHTMFILASKELGLL